MTQNSKFDNFLQQLSEGKQFKQYLKRGTKQYDILKYKVSDLSVHEIKKNYAKILQNYNQNKNYDHFQIIETQEPYWIINQLKTFVWIAVCYAAHNHQHLSSLNQESWEFLVSVFYFKPVQILQFQLLSLLKAQSPKVQKKWSKAQDQLLKTILRKPQKCREHWFNHLNPAISHEPWSVEQDLALIQNVNSKGKKWAQISICIGGQRTQHMVKNRYKSLENKFDKEIYKSSKKILEVSMILNSLPASNQKDQELELKKEESSQTCDPKKEINLIGASFPTNIDGVSMEQQLQQIIEIDQNLKPLLEQNLIQVSENKFFSQTKKSISLMSELDDDFQKYVESFLF